MNNSLHSHAVEPKANHCGLAMSSSSFGEADDDCRRLNQLESSFERGSWHGNRILPSLRSMFELGMATLLYYVSSLIVFIFSYVVVAWYFSRNPRVSNCLIARV